MPINGQYLNRLAISFVGVSKKINTVSLWLNCVKIKPTNQILFPELKAMYANS